MLWNDYAAVGNKPESSNNRLAYSLAGCHVRDQIVPHLSLPQGPQRSGFPLCHHDLGTQNIFVDDDFNITCVIDWAFSSTVPPVQLLSTPGLPHPRDLVTDPALVHAFQSGFEDESVKLGAVSPQPTHWKTGGMLSQLMLLVRLDALQDYHHLEALHELALGCSASEHDSLRARLVGVSTSPELLALAEALKADDEPESQVKRHETQYFNSVGEERFALARKITQLSQHDAFFVADRRRLWTKVIDGCAVETTRVSTPRDLERHMSSFRSHISNFLDIDSLGGEGPVVQPNKNTRQCGRAARHVPRDIGCSAAYPVANTLVHTQIVAQFIPSARESSCPPSETGCDGCASRRHGTILGKVLSHSTWNPLSTSKVQKGCWTICPACWHWLRSFNQ